MSAMLTTEDGPGRRHRVVIGSGCGGLTVDGEPGRRRATAGASLSVEVGAGRRHSQFLPELRHQDRGDSGGVVSPVSKPEALEAQLRKYAAVHV
jgi:hypothetical protein